MKQKISVSTALIVTVAIFITVIVITKLFKLEELPSQTIGVLFGGVITALITYFLLLGQTQAEENKERNVKVFEEKSERYNRFISELWKIWDDKQIKLVELKELVKLVTQDIVPYTDKKAVLKILKSLNKLSDNHNSNLDYKTLRKQNQQHIYDILKVLSNEIGLGGDITEETRTEINLLEEKILPVLYLSEFKKEFLTKFTNKINDSKLPFSSCNYQENNNCFYINIEKSNIEIELNNFNYDDNEQQEISFFVEYYSNEKYHPYRLTSRGDSKNYLKNILKTELIPSFLNEELAESMYKNENGINEMVNKLYTEVEIFYNNPVIDNKTISDLIQICE